jgi:hypothetical protein
MEKYGLRVKVSNWFKTFWRHYFCWKIHSRFEHGIAAAKAKRKALMAGIMIADTLRQRIVKRYVIEAGKDAFIKYWAWKEKPTYAIMKLAKLKKDDFMKTSFKNRGTSGKMGLIFEVMEPSERIR